MTRAIVAVELLHVSKNGIMEFKETPAVNEVIKRTYMYIMLLDVYPIAIGSNVLVKIKSHILAKSIQVYIFFASYVRET